MSRADWDLFLNHHKNLESGKWKAKQRNISLAWGQLSPTEKSTEAAAIRSGQGRTLQNFRDRVWPAPPPPSGGPTTASPDADAIPDAATGSPQASTSASDVEEARKQVIWAYLMEKDELVNELPPPDPEEPEFSRWLGGWNVGGRGLNRACVWLRFDDNQQVVERAIIKDVAPKPPTWVDMTRWEGEPRDLNNRRPIECVIHERLCKTDGAAYFVNLRAWRNFATKNMYRMVMAYCDQANAEQLAKSFYPRFEPEPFMWRILEHLVEASIVMESGSLSECKEGWLQIIHRDLKADNVFMTTDEACYYPKPLVADFEFAIQTSADDRWNPGVYKSNECGVSTGAWFLQPPEATHEDFIHPRPSEVQAGWKILAPANVWCIGMTMWQILHGGIYPKQDRYTYSPKDRWRNFDNHVKTVYSEPLIEMIERCLNHEPARRPTLAELRHFVTEQDLGNRTFKVCRDARNVATAADLQDVMDLEMIEDAWKYKHPKDEYSIGTERKDITFMWAQSLNEANGQEQYEEAGGQTGEDTWGDGPVTPPRDQVKDDDMNKAMDDEELQREEQELTRREQELARMEQELDQDEDEAELQRQEQELTRQEQELERMEQELDEDELGP